MPVAKLKTFCKKKALCNVVVETPQHSRHKFSYDEASDLFKVTRTLPEGMSFPYDFGFIPGTKGQDGDPLDVLIFMDAPAFPGCLLEARVIGVLKACQTEDGETVENDRLLAVYDESNAYRKIESVSDLDERLLDQINEFFVQYNKLAGKKYKPQGIGGKAEAEEIIERGMKEFRRGGK